MGSVSINPPKTPVTKGSSSVAAATLPNVCKMPGPPAPFVPTPLPNIGKSDNSPQGYSKSVDIEGQPVAIAGASFGSTGDVASQGTGGGLISSNTQGPTKFIGPGSFNVQIESKNVQLLGDPMLNNCGASGSPANAGTMTGVIHASGEMTVIYGDDKPCRRCGKTHPLEAGDKTLEMVRTLMKGLRRKFEEQKERIKELSEIARDGDGMTATFWQSSSSRPQSGSDGLSLADRAAHIAELIQRPIAAPRSASTNPAHILQTQTLCCAGIAGAKPIARATWSGVSRECSCGAKRLAACSGKSTSRPPCYHCSGNAVCECPSQRIGTGLGGHESWACAAKQIVETLEGHGPDPADRALVRADRRRAEGHPWPKDYVFGIGREPTDPSP